MVIRWLMYIALSAYCLLDYYHTIALIGCGYTEANPIVVWIIGPDEVWIRALYVKIFFLLMLGILLIFKRRL